MPTYQYACTACGERMEAVQSFTDAPLTDCPACSGPLRKVFSAVGVVFKGSGFYKTDSRGKAPSSGESKPATESSSAPAKTESSSTPAASTTSSTPASKTA